MIIPVRDNILVRELVKDSRAGNLIVSQDESSAYMFAKVDEISSDALYDLYDTTAAENMLELKQKLLSGDYLLVLSRTAKLPFIQDRFFISIKDIRAVIDKKEFEEL